VTGGAGIVHRLSRCAWKMAIEEDMAILVETEDDVTTQNVEIQEGRPLADNEIRQEISPKSSGARLLMVKIEGFHSTQCTLYIFRLL
jgi:hypothetical protein